MKIMRRKLLLARQRDRARRIKIARLTSSLRKTRDVTTHRPRKRSEKKDDESSKHGDDDEKEKIKKEDDEDADTTTEKGDDVDEVKKDGKTDDEEEEDEDTKDKDDKDDDSKTKSPKARKIKSNFIKLTCVHCRAKCLTFKEYSNHLYSRSHRVAMRRLSLRQKAQLAQMRMKQRNAQRDIEESSKDELEDCKPQFCLLCRLNYRQPKAKHQLSEAHRNMKKFLMPYCSTCHIAFKSPMMYEAHRCSLDHIKRKARNNESHSDASGDEKEVDLNNFMTVDSVGEIDGHLEEIEDKAEDEVKESKVNVGAEHVKKTEGFYCDLCRLFFACKEDEEAVLKKHCATRSHLKAFLRYKEDQNLRAEAERIQRRQKDKKDVKKEGGDKSEKDKDHENGEDNEEGGEDKLWEDVDKDLGDLLREVGPEGHEDDEEDGSVLNINIERFDRFKNSEKQKQKASENGTEGEEETSKKADTTEQPSPVKAKKEDAKTTAKTEEKAAADAK